MAQVCDKHSHNHSQLCWAVQTRHRQSRDSQPLDSALSQLALSRSPCSPGKISQTRVLCVVTGPRQSAAGRDGSAREWSRKGGLGCRRKQPVAEPGWGSGAGARSPVRGQQMERDREGWHWLAARRGGREVIQSWQAPLPWEGAAPERWAGGEGSAGGKGEAACSSSS